MNKPAPKIIEAILGGNVSLLDERLQAGFDVNAEDSRCYTALHYAVEQGSAEMMTLLIGAGAKVNAYDEKGVTPLHVAIEKQFFDLADKLLAAGADINFSDGDKGMTPLHVAVFEAIGTSQSAGAEYLLLKNARVNVPDVSGRTVAKLIDGWVSIHPVAARIKKLIEKIGQQPAPLPVQAQTAATSVPASEEAAASAPVSAPQVSALALLEEKRRRVRFVGPLFKKRGP